MLAACVFPVPPDSVKAAPSDRNYTQTSCADLGTEKNRIESELYAVIGHYKSNTKERIAQLKGEANAVNDALFAKNCGIAPVHLP